jgi:hypothetical protein
VVWVRINQCSEDSVNSCTMVMTTTPKDKRQSESWKLKNHSFRTLIRTEECPQSMPDLNISLCTKHKFSSVNSITNWTMITSKMQHLSPQHHQSFLLSLKETSRTCWLRLRTDQWLKSRKLLWKPFCLTLQATMIYRTGSGTKEAAFQPSKRHLKTHS